jgi:hypothetical protein
MTKIISTTSDKLSLERDRLLLEMAKGMIALIGVVGRMWPEGLSGIAGEIENARRNLKQALDSPD